MMSQKEFEDLHGVRLEQKDKSLFMRFLNVLLWPFSFMEFYTTYRLPFQKRATITYPKGQTAMGRLDILEHELGHVKQFMPWYGPFVVGLATTLLPLPVFFSGRWLVERHPYLGDIKRGRMTVEDAVMLLWGGYGWCWPRFLMRKWFNGKLK